jgi:hypothetical protein
MPYRLLDDWPIAVGGFMLLVFMLFARLQHWHGPHLYKIYAITLVYGLGAKWWLEAKNAAAVRAFAVAALLALCTIAWQIFRA